MKVYIRKQTRARESKSEENERPTRLKPGEFYDIKKEEAKNIDKRKGIIVTTGLGGNEKELLEEQKIYKKAMAAHYEREAVTAQEKADKLALLAMEAADRAKKKAKEAKQQAA